MGVYKHGLTDMREYRLWKMVKRRCYSSWAVEYKWYGGRGIGMSEEWTHNAKSFYDHITALPHYNEEGYTLDRIDNDGDYAPGNVRWADRHTQVTNARKRIDCSKYGVGVVKSRNHFFSRISIHGKTYSLGHHDTPCAALAARDKHIITNRLWEYEVQTKLMKPLKALSNVGLHPVAMWLLQLWSTERNLTNKEKYKLKQRG